MLLAHAGNRVDPPDRADQRFPAANVADVRRRVGRLLDSLAPGGLISAPAAGADLIVLEAAAARGIPVHVVLPLAAEEFEAASVADLGAEWVAGYRRLVDRARHGGGTLVEIGLAGDGDWYEPANRSILDRARELAASTGEALAALAIRPPVEPDEPSVTDDFAARARRLGVPVLDLDPSRPLSALPRALVLDRTPGTGPPVDGVVDRIVVPALEDADIDWAVVSDLAGPQAVAGAEVLVLPSTDEPALVSGRAADLIAGTAAVGIVVLASGTATGERTTPPGGRQGRPGRPDVRLFAYPREGLRITDREAMSAWPGLAAVLAALPAGRRPETA